MEEPKRNYESTAKEKKKYVEYLLLKAVESGDSAEAWKVVDYLLDTCLLDEIK